MAIYKPGDTSWTTKNAANAGGMQKLANMSRWSVYMEGGGGGHGGEGEGQWVKKVRDPGGDYVVDLVETKIFFAHLELR